MTGPDPSAPDRAEITSLVHEYAERLDAGDLDAVAALFEQATWRSDAAGRALRGIDEVRRVYDRVVLYDGSPRTKHLISNLVVDIDPGAATAGGRCCFTVLQGVVPGEPIEVILGGRYLDRFEKIAGRWRFADRLFVTDVVGDLSRHFR